MWGRHSKRLKAEMPCQGMSFKWLVWLRCLGMAAGEWLNMSWHGEVCRYCSLEALSRESHWSGLGFGQGVQRSGVLSHCFLMQGSEAEHAIYNSFLSQVSSDHYLCGFENPYGLHPPRQWWVMSTSLYSQWMSLPSATLQSMNMAWGQGGYLVQLLPPKMSIHFPWKLLKIHPTSSSNSL